MNNVLERYELWKDSQNEIENINSPIAIIQLEFIIKILTTKKVPDPEGFSSKFYHFCI